MEEEFGAAAVEFHVAEFVNAEQVDATVAGDRSGELFLVGSFDEFVDEFGREGVFDAVAFLCCGGAEPDEEVAFAGPGVADQAQWFAFANPVTGRELVDRGGVHVLVRVEIEVPEPFVPGEAGSVNAAGRRASVTVIAFREEEFGEEALVG